MILNASDDLDHLVNLGDLATVPPLRRHLTNVMKGMIFPKIYLVSKFVE
jgi:hypothetical protein